MNHRAWESQIDLWMHPWMMFGALADEVLDGADAGRVTPPMVSEFG
jgi:hypothetical protein